jgi:hypothetical protein
MAGVARCRGLCRMCGERYAGLESVNIFEARGTKPAYCDLLRELLGLNVRTITFEMLLIRYIYDVNALKLNFQATKVISKVEYNIKIQSDITLMVVQNYFFNAVVNILSLKLLQYFETEK